MAGSKHLYFAVWSDAGAKEIPGGQWNSSMPADWRFPLAVFAEAEKALKECGLHFYLTKNPYRLPEYGPHVVAVLLQEERCKLPYYARHVRAVIRNLESIPFLGFQPRVGLNRMGLVLAFEYARDWALHWRSVRVLAAHHQPDWPAAVNDRPRIFTIPLGYHSQEELPQIPMCDRTLDAFFAGSLSTGAGWRSYKRWTSTSKVEARKQLWRVLERLKRNPEWTIDLSNIDVGLNPGSSTHSHSYSVKMANSRICLAPRGTRPESYRLYEGLRAGCLVITNRLPDRPFLSGAPVIQVDNWKELPALFRRYARDLDALEHYRQASLDWWQSHCSEGVIGRQVANFLDDPNQGVLLGVLAAPLPPASQIS